MRPDERITDPAQNLARICREALGAVDDHPRSRLASGRADVRAGGLRGRNGDEFRYGVQSVFPCSRSPDSRGEHHDGYVQEASVRLLLTSAGVKNPSIRDALVDLLGKPIADSSALCIPTAQYRHPLFRPASPW